MKNHTLIKFICSASEKQEMGYGFIRAKIRSLQAPKGRGRSSRLSRVRAVSSLIVLVSSAIGPEAVGEELTYPKILAGMQRDYSDPQRNCALFLQKRTTVAIQAKVPTLDLKEFSTRTTLHGQERGLHLEVGSLEAAVRAGQPDRAFRDAIGLDRLWPASLVPFEEYRRIGFEKMPEILRTVSAEAQRRSPEVKESAPLTLDEVEEMISSPLPAGKGEFNEKFLRVHMAEMKVRRKNLKPPNAVLLLLCGSQGRILDAPECARALGEILDSMSPTGVTLADMTLIDEFEELYRSDVHIEPLRRLALKILKGVRSGEVPTGNLFEDLQAAYLSSGMSESEAYEATWRYLGVSATGGVNTSHRLARLPHQDTARQFYPLLFGVINMGSSVLDARSLKNSGRFYSYPENVVSMVENSKPYHFWLSAYLARKSALLIRKPDAAANAAWLAQLGYQVLSQTVGRDPIRAFTADPFGPENNKIRLDLAYAANGAVFGANAAHRLPAQTFDVNATLRSLLSHGEALPVLNASDARELFEGEGYFAWRRWRRIFNPESAIRTAKESL